MKGGTVAAVAVLAAVLASAPVHAQPAREALYDEGLAHYEAGRYADALTAFTKAAHAGHLRAQEIAGFMNLLGPRLYGEGVAEDRGAAQRWLARAAGQGSEVTVLIVRRMEDAPSAVAMEPRR
jgi:TPR repeat protein